MSSPSARGRSVLRVLTVLFVLSVFTLFLWLSRSMVVLTSGGVYDSIQLPIGSGAMRWRADQSTVASSPRLRGLHGPVIRRDEGGRLVADYVCGTSVERSSASGDSVVLACDGVDRVYRVHATTVPALATLPAVSRIAVVSDLEGDVEYFRQWARDLGVIDSAGRWQYGTGHVVVVGDVMDRGRWVYDLLWTLYDLEAQASAAGGGLHVLLGNHELYDLTGITKDIEAEHHYAMSLLGSYHQLLDTRSVLGQWLRSRNVVQRIGRTLFVHGGISPSILAEDAPLDSLNARHQRVLGSLSHVDKNVRRMMLDAQTVTQYRGFVMAQGEDSPRASEAHVAAVLAWADVDQIVIGHTEVDSITPLYDRRVFDVNASLTRAEALVIEDGIPAIRSIQTQRRAFSDSGSTVRRFSLVNATDWRALLGVFGVMSR